jgi:hypothetical protein
LAQIILREGGGGGIKDFSNEEERPSTKGDDNKRVVFSRTSWPFSIKLGTIYPWVEEIQICSNKGLGPIQRGENHKNVKIGWVHLKIFSTNYPSIYSLLGLW